MDKKHQNPQHSDLYIKTFGLGDVESVRLYEICRHWKKRTGFQLLKRDHPLSPLHLEH